MLGEAAKLGSGEGKGGSSQPKAKRRKISIYIFSLVAGVRAFELHIIMFLYLLQAVKACLVGVVHL